MMNASSNADNCKMPPKVPNARFPSNMLEIPPSPKRKTPLMLCWFVGCESRLKCFV